MKNSQLPSKDDLERQKLALEIQELERRWWQRPVYLSILLPVVLAALTVLAGILSGYFNQERRRLKDDVALLKKQKSDLVQNANSLAAENKAAREQLQTTTELLNRVNVEAIKLNKALEEERDSRPEEPKINRKPKPSPSPN